MDEPTKMVINLSNTKPKKAMDHLDEKYIEMFREVEASGLPKLQLDKKTLGEFLKAYSELSDEVDTIVFSHGVFYSAVVRMHEVAEEYALDAIESKVFPQQLKGLKMVLKFIETLHNFYLNKKDDGQANQTGLDKEPAGSKG